MNRTYEEILDSMKGAYFNECHSPVENNSQALRRLEILASELFSLSCYGDYILRQAFVQSATGENLDRLGEIRGCTRKTAACSEGELTFGISEVSSEDIIIPANTVCSVFFKPYMQFATKEQCVISAGSKEVSVGAVSLNTGNEYNVRANEITVMVNAPLGISTVTNKSSFDSGCDEETDAAYRKRILRHYGILSNAINCTCYENQVLTLDYVTDCHIVPESNDEKMHIYVSTKSNSLNASQRREIIEKIAVINAAGVDYELSLSEKVYFELYVNAVIMRGFNADEIKEKICKRISDVVSTACIGESIAVSRLEAAVADIDGLVECDFYSNLINKNVISNSGTVVLVLSDTVVNCVYD